MPINSFEFLILILYAWILWYVYQSIVEELDQLTAIKMNQGQLTEQLQQLGLEGQLMIQCGFSRTPLAEEMRTFTLIVVNGLPEGNYLYLDWQRSTFRTFKNEVKRLFRIPQGQNLDLFEGQSISIVAPGETLVEIVTLENCLMFDKEAGYSIVKPIFSIPELKMARGKGLQFGVNIFFQEPARPEYEKIERFYAITCPFNVVKLPWQNAVYWKPKR
ncbi:hypothetical protein Lepto7376_2796 [[Leptolyngbya] sp. PCC 7376]|uniref:hypothetical protein n=1 Tax=[Leptolyngbya] sp. PCC 7376 TaxID=111781 RepID=UPI00029EF868|nr:hypothetical protein [[Leptolyngbya] sp. PCC 7376]AFY39053.1 hypothetical protein Lepto7376_2796 [[Leptolyngbya] sp. PCC 7376]